MNPSEGTVRGRLARVEDPFLGASIVDLGLVADVHVDETTVHVSVALNAPHAPDERRIGDRIREELASIDRQVRVYADPPTGIVGQPLPHVKNLLAVTSHTAGVGRAAVAVNVAAELADRGAHVGILDADPAGTRVWSLLDAATDACFDADGVLVPGEGRGVKVASLRDALGASSPAVSDTLVGEHVVAGLLHDTAWQPLHYLFVVAPPVADDAASRLLDVVPTTAGIVVTAPDVAGTGAGFRVAAVLDDCDVSLLGVVQNVLALECPSCGGRWQRFGESGVDRTSLPQLGTVSFTPADGVVVDGDGAAAVAALADAVTNEVGALHRLSASAAAGTGDCSDSPAGEQTSSPDSAGAASTWLL